MFYGSAQPVCGKPVLLLDFPSIYGEYRLLLLGTFSSFSATRSPYTSCRKTKPIFHVLHLGCCSFCWNRYLLIHTYSTVPCMLLLSRVSAWVLKQEATMSAVVALLAAGSRAHSTTSFVGPPPLRGIVNNAPKEHHPAPFSLRGKIGDGRSSCAALRLIVGSSPLQLHDVEGLFSPSTVSRRQSRRWSRASPTLASIRSAVDGAACEDSDHVGGMPSGRSSIRRGDGAPRDASRQSRERELFARSTSGGEPPPLQDEMWSKHSVFEFKR